MADIKQVTDNFSVAPQIEKDDLPQIAAAGFKTIVNNRPDGETFDQMTCATCSAAAQAAGLTYHEIKFAGMPQAEQIDEMVEVLKTAQSPIFAYCRSGTRSCTLWTIASVKSGQETPETALQKARNAGYDLSHLGPMLANL